MQSLTKAVANALSFAHLAGLGRAKSKAKADDDEKKDGKDSEFAESDEDDAKAESDDDKKDDDDGKKDSKAESDDKKDDETDDDKKSKKAAKADDDSDDDEKAAAGAKKERARCAAIFASPHAAGNVALAAQLAFGTDLSAEQAIQTLAVAPVAQRGNPERVARNPSVGSGGGAQLSSKQAASMSMDRAFAKANPNNAKRQAG